MSTRSSFHQQLARGDAKIRLAGLGVFVGLIAGLIVCFFRFTLSRDIPFMAQGMEAENFESLHPALRFVFPIAGCLLIIIIFHFLKPAPGSMGVSYVIHKVQKFRGHMPIRNALAQFFGATIALLSGGSCGREGPAIHLGATSGSVLGYWLQLPHNSIRTLIACGSAAAISASFNTPIAGVIFAMEVIMMEYAISSFIPVIISSVSAAVITQVLFGNEAVFDIASSRMNSLWEIPYVAVLGILLGLLASIFARLLNYAGSFHQLKFSTRLLCIGVATGSLGLFIPEVMGIGYDTVNLTIQGGQSVYFLGLLLTAKLCLSAMSLGLGLPGGVIGPTLMMGGLAGGIAGALIAGFFPGSDPAFYVLLGMCSMMGAALQAPLAALMTLLELSNNPNIILPAMIIIVCSNLTYSEILRTKSVFFGTSAENHAAGQELARFLNRYAVSSIVQNNFIEVTPETPKQELESLLIQQNDWIILDQGDEDKCLIRLADLNKNLPITLSTLQAVEAAPHHPLVAVSDRATLQEALEIMQESECSYAYIYRGPKHEKTILGIITIDQIIAFYRD